MSKTKVSFKARQAVSKNENGIKDGEYNARIVGVHIEDRTILKASKYETEGDIASEFKLVMQAEIDGEDKIVSTWGMKAKFWKGASAKSKGFSVLSEVFDLSDTKTQALIDENTDEDGSFDYGVFIGVDVVLEYETKAGKEYASLSRFKKGVAEYEVEGVELPEWLFASKTKDGEEHKKNMMAGYVEEFTAIPANQQLIESLELTCE